MKKTLLYSAACMLALSSCDMDINENPNYPSAGDITPTLEFPAVVNSVVDVPGEQMFILGGFFVQYFEQRPEQNQYNTIAELHFDESSDLFNQCYRTIYAGALMDIKDIEGKTTNTANLFACKVMKALALQYMVDACSDAPYSEACMGNENPNPKWEDGETIYKGVLAEMDEAEAALTGESMDMTDPLLGGDIAKWKQFANAVRLRMYLRLIDGGIDASNYTSKVKTIVAGGVLPASDVTYDVYSDAEGQYNPWYASVFSLGTNNYCAAHPLVAYYQATNDPRIGYAILPATATSKYVGLMPGSRTLYQDWDGSKILNKDVSTINTDVARAMPVYVFTESEIDFLKAEVELRFNNNKTAAKAAYEAGVKADFASRGVDGASDFLAGAKVNFDAQATDNDKLKLIYMQKWAAYFYRNHMEAWSEMRRTDVPVQTSLTTEEAYKDPTKYNAGDVFSPGLNYYGNGKTCKRMPYPSLARKLNKNTPAVKTLADPVFWDVK
ncbi:MAG: SusD/RagB family nutrient-binding outer membrane lipoprotein [Prevotella sp.]